MPTMPKGKTVCEQVYLDARARIAANRGDVRDEVIVALWGKSGERLEALHDTQKRLDTAMADNRNYSRKQDMLQSWLHRHSAEFGTQYQDTISHCEKEDDKSSHS